MIEAGDGSMVGKSHIDELIKKKVILMKSLKIFNEGTLLHSIMTMRQENYYIPNTYDLKLFEFILKDAFIF